MGMVTARERAEDSVSMAKLVFGEEFVDEHTVMTSICNANSPLVWDATMLDALKVYARHNQAVLLSPFVLAGASTPASTVGAVAQLNAEALAGIAFGQLVRAGSPMVYGQWINTVSMQSGAPMAGTPEMDHMNLMVGQLARFYRLPWRCSAMMTDAKVVDAQAGYEAMRGDQSVILLRHRDGHLRGFHNVCQHRAHRLLEGEGGVKSAITCPYHAWTYDLAGELRHARRSERVQGFDRAAVCLTAVRVESFCGFVFYNFDRDAAPMREQFAELQREIRSFSPHPEKLRRAYRREYPLAANWKNSVENFSECYHCPNRHKGLLEGALDIDSYRIAVHDTFHSHTSRDRGDRQAYTLDRAGAGRGDEFGGWLVWPNLSLEVYPGGYMNVFCHHPVDIERTVQLVEWYFETETPTAAQQEIIDFLHVVRSEDVPICESVQRGLHSMGYRQGRFMVDPERSDWSEHAVHDFQVKVLRSLGDGA